MAHHCDSSIRPLRWQGGPEGVLELLDQTLLPVEVRWIACTTVESLHDAIRRLVVRGAPAIGVAAAYGVVLGLGRGWPRPSREWMPRLREVCACLAGARPTAVNLAWALGRMQRVAESIKNAPLDDARTRLLAEAVAIRDEDAAMCRAIGQAGQHLVADGAGVLTHCNAGALATAEFGTALAPLYVAHAMGRRFRVFVDETRPLLQGARLTAWELQRAGIEATLICDNMAAQVMREGRISLVVVGADRIAANGDTANKIGTYGLAVLARHHDIPFYVAAPLSTFDPAIPTGDAIPIEQRDPDEIRAGFGRTTAPPGMPCYNPAFDVTPAGLITGIITPRGIWQPADLTRRSMQESTNP